MGFGLSDSGELALLRKYFKNETVLIGIYYDDPENGGDDLADSDGVEAIGTEPTGGDYSRQKVQPSDVTVTMNSDGDGEIEIDVKTFAVDHTSQRVDAFFLHNSNTGEFISRGPLDTSNRSADYISLDQVTDLQVGGSTLGGEAITLD